MSGSQLHNTKTRCAKKKKTDEKEKGRENTKTQMERDKGESKTNET